MTTASYSYGSILVDEEGISRRRPMLLGSVFKISWDDMQSWAVTRAFKTTMDTGQAELVCQEVELRAASAVETVDRKTAGDMLDALVAYLRLKCPDKETEAASAEEV